MNKIFSLLLIVAIFSQGIRAEDKPATVDDAKKKLSENIQTCFSDSVCNKAQDCLTKVNEGFKCVLDLCATADVYAKDDWMEKIDACMKTNLVITTDCGKKFTQAQLDGVNKCGEEPMSSKVLAVFGLVLSIFLMI